MASQLHVKVFIPASEYHKLKEAEEILRSIRLSGCKCGKAPEQTKIHIPKTISASDQSGSGLVAGPSSEPVECFENCCDANARKKNQAARMEGYGMVGVPEYIFNKDKPNMLSIRHEKQPRLEDTGEIVGHNVLGANTVQQSSQVKQQIAQPFTPTLPLKPSDTTPSLPSTSSDSISKPSPNQTQIESALNVVRKKYKHKAKELVDKLQEKGELHLNPHGHLVFEGEPSNLPLSTALCLTFYNIKSQSVPSDIKKWLQLLVDTELELYVINDHAYDSFAWYKI